MVQLMPQVAGAAVSVVSSCATRAQLLRDTRRVQPDVILLDLRMPDREDQPCTLGGAEIIAALQRQHPGVRVICLSAHVEPERVRACLEAGAAGYEVAHRAVGLARQAAMPALETLLRALADALEAGALEEAQRLGQCLPEALAAVRHVLAGGRNRE
ncbi:response regulator transcription factor [Caldichromatium japonicum]|uniref:Response regulator transcription factor n=2 Tax=Caldichromatium japonicum TaxID=2699430 RepID=A0A6G7VGL0_9GAMM|nr:response regulator transcription factor [Caldichromatium japonicum]